MPEIGPSSRLHTWLFRLTMGLTATLILLVLLAPWLPGEALPRGRLADVLATFARDAVVRRTTLGAAVGLMATAFVFFRVPQPGPAMAPSVPFIPPKRKTG